MDPAAFERAARFLRTYAEEAQRRGHELPVPAISVGPKGSVDVFWRLGEFELLVNIPCDAEQPAPFYGDDRSSVIRGELGADPSTRLLAWLIPTA